MAEPKTYWKQITLTVLALFALVFYLAENDGDLGAVSTKAFANIFQNGGGEEHLLETIDLNNLEPKPDTKKIDIPPESAPIYKIFISEISFNPQGGDKGKEFITLYNEENVEVDLTGWSIKIGTENQNTLLKIGGSKEDKIIIKAKGFFLAGFNSFTGMPLPDTKRSASLPNTGATITLNNKDNLIVDVAIYESLGERQNWTRF